MEYLSVAFKINLNSYFDYMSGSYKDISKGDLVYVEFGRQRLIGIVIDIKSSSNYADCKTILAHYKIGLPKHLIILLSFVSKYYHYPIGKTYFEMLPSLIHKLEYLSLNNSYRAIANLNIETKGLTPGHKKILEYLIKNSVIPELKARKFSTKYMQFINKLIGNKIIIKETKPLISVNSIPKSRLIVKPRPYALNEEQLAAIRYINNIKGFDVIVINGVTGSGKTEVYLELIADVLQNGKQVLLMSPEIMLASILRDCCYERFSNIKLMLIHSKKSSYKRMEDWIEAENADLILGSRSALFAKFNNLGLIIVDEEHDVSYKQDNGLMYNAKDLAIYLAKELNIKIALGSATPSVETSLNIRRSRFKEVSIKHRAHKGARMPEVRILDLSDYNKKDLLHKESINLIDTELSNNNSILIYLNRRGFAPVSRCNNCKWIARCSACNTLMVFHADSDKLICHICKRSSGFNSKCPDCSSDIEYYGFGTQKIESIIRSKYSSYNIFRLDSDVFNNDLSLELSKSLESADLIIATKLISKGHNIKRLGAAIITDIDAGLYSTSMMAEEACFSNMMQVIGRVGRHDINGKVYIQTRSPGHRFFKYLKTNDFGGFSDAILEDRRISGSYPYVYSALLFAESKKLKSLNVFMEALKYKLDLESHSSYKGISVYDPVPMNIALRNYFHRAQILIESKIRKDLHKFLDFAIEDIEKPSNIKLFLDIDPKFI